jgi:putative transcriptional regulator
MSPSSSSTSSSPHPSSSASDLETPVLLLAMPQVLDPHFHRSVVLLLRHEEEGSFGFIVNRPLETRLLEILEDLDIAEWTGSRDAPAHFGGPVQPQLGSVLFAPEDDEHLEGEAITEVIPGVGLTHHVGDLERLAKRPPRRFRLLLGYAAWGGGQLMEEILRNDWLLAPVDPDLIFATDAETLWDTALRSVGVDPASLPSWTGTQDTEGAN